MESMTGYGSAEAVAGPLTISAEAKSVNGRHLDLKVRIPAELNALEPEIRQAARDLLARGTVSLTVNVAGPAASAGINLTEARRLHFSLQQLKRELDLEGNVDLDILTRFPAIIQGRPPEVEPALLHKAVLKAVLGALKGLKASRKREGAALKSIISRHVSSIEALVRNARRVAPIDVKALQETLRQRIRRLTEGPLDNLRLEQEAAYLASRSDFTEELDRLAAHIKAFRELLRKEGSVGRNLEFLAQETHRELTTIASKTSGVEVSRLTIQARVELEKLKEQVYNVD